VNTTDTLFTTTQPSLIIIRFADLGAGSTENLEVRIYIGSDGTPSQRQIIASFNLAGETDAQGRSYPTVVDSGVAIRVSRTRYKLVLHVLEL